MLALLATSYLRARSKAGQCYAHHVRGRVVCACGAVVFALLGCGDDEQLPPGGRGGDQAGGSGGFGGSGASATGGVGNSGGAGGAGGQGAGGNPWPTEPYASCEGMAADACQGESCCTTLSVPGGSFPMGRSVAGSDACPVGDNCDDASEMPEHPATVSSFELDKYEVTVGRFRKFVNWYVANTVSAPAAGWGEHPQIPGSGWNSDWDSSLAGTQESLTAALGQLSYPSWTDMPGPNEQKPITTMNWFEAFAFCIWDGGRLPTEAEWEYAAAGGDENRLYPWGSQPPDETLAVYDCDGDGMPFCELTDLLDVGSLPLGNGRWGHSDLAGSVKEYVLDAYDTGWYAGAGATCDDCANTAFDNLTRVRRGGSWDVAQDFIRAAHRLPASELSRSGFLGFRCARNP